MTNKLKIFCGNSNRPLTEKICKALKIKVADALVDRFSDGEIRVKINDNVRGEDVFVVQSTSYSANDNLMEALIMFDALKRASASRITAVLPYFGYALPTQDISPLISLSLLMYSFLYYYNY